MLTKFENVVGVMCSVCLMSSRLWFSAVVTEASLSDVVPMVSLLSATKLCHVADDVVDVLHRSADLVRAVGEQTGDACEVLVELAHQIGARLQRRDQDRDVLDRAEQVLAVVAERGEGLRQLDQRVADVGALSPQVVRRGADELAERADAAGLGRLQRVGEPLQLLRRSSHSTGTAVCCNGIDGVVSDRRAAGVGRGQLDGAHGHQRR